MLCRQQWWSQVKKWSLPFVCMCRMKQLFLIQPEVESGGCDFLIRVKYCCINVSSAGNGGKQADRMDVTSLWPGGRTSCKIISGFHSCFFSCSYTGATSDKECMRWNIYDLKAKAGKVNKVVRKIWGPGHIYSYWSNNHAKHSQNWFFTKM